MTQGGRTIWLLHLDVEAEPALLGIVRHAVETWLTAAGWPRDGTELMTFAATETVSNSIEHAYRGLDAGRVRIDLSREAAQACLEVSDDGTWRTESAGRDRGNGLALVAALADSLVIATSDSGTHVTVSSAISEQDRRPITAPKPHR